jgi:hypothetical protein
MAGDRTVRRRVTYADVAATLALVVALSTGTAYAVPHVTAALARGSVTGAMIRDHTITAADVKVGGLVGADIAPGTLSANRFARGQLPRVTTGSAAIDSTGHTILTDPSTGVQLRTSAVSPGLVVDNPTGYPVALSGMGFYFGVAPESRSHTVAPHSTTLVSFQGTGFAYAQLLVQRMTSSSAQPLAQVTCAESEQAGGVFEMSCVVVSSPH